MTPQNTTAYVEITLEETATQAHVPATLYYHEEKQVFLKPIDLSRMLEGAWHDGWNNRMLAEKGKYCYDAPTYINSILNPPK